MGRESNRKRLLEKPNIDKSNRASERLKRDGSKANWKRNFDENQPKPNFDQPSGPSRAVYVLMIAFSPAVRDIYNPTADGPHWTQVDGGTFILGRMKKEQLQWLLGLSDHQIRDLGVVGKTTAYKALSFDWGTRMGNFIYEVLQKKFPKDTPEALRKKWEELRIMRFYIRNEKNQFSFHRDNVNFQSTISWVYARPVDERHIGSGILVRTFFNMVEASEYHMDHYGYNEIPPFRASEGRLLPHKDTTLGRCCHGPGVLPMSDTYFTPRDTNQPIPDYVDLAKYGRIIIFGIPQGTLWRFKSVAHCVETLHRCGELFWSYGSVSNAPNHSQRLFQREVLSEDAPIAPGRQLVDVGDGDDKSAEIKDAAVKYHGGEEGYKQYLKECEETHEKKCRRRALYLQRRMANQSDDTKDEDQLIQEALQKDMSDEDDDDMSESEDLNQKPAAKPKSNDDSQEDIPDHDKKPAAKRKSAEDNSQPPPSKKQKPPTVKDQITDGAMDDKAKILAALQGDTSESEDDDVSTKKRTASGTVVLTKKEAKKKYYASSSSSSSEDDSPKQRNKWNPSGFDSSTDDDDDENQQPAVLNRTKKPAAVDTSSKKKRPAKKALSVSHKKKKKPTKFTLGPNSDDDSYSDSEESWGYDSEEGDSSVQRRPVVARRSTRVSQKFQPLPVAESATAAATDDDDDEEEDPDSGEKEFDWDE